MSTCNSPGCNKHLTRQMQDYIGVHSGAPARRKVFGLFMPTLKTQTIDLTDHLCALPKA